MPAEESPLRYASPGRCRPQALPVDDDPERAQPACCGSRPRRCGAGDFAGQGSGRVGDLSALSGSKWAASTVEPTQQYTSVGHPQQ